MGFSSSAFNCALDHSSHTGQDNSACASAYKQKLAIIPFENLNEDEGDGLLVDGIVEDLITEFSMIKELSSISRQPHWSLDFVVSDIIGSHLRLGKWGKPPTSLKYKTDSAFRIFETIKV